MSNEDNGVIGESPAQQNNPVNADQDTQTLPSPEQGDVQLEKAIDGRGVPIENVEAEWKRKHDQLAERLPEYISEAVNEAVKSMKELNEQQNNSARKEEYTPEQLAMVIDDDTGQYTSQNKVWARLEFKKHEHSEFAKLLDDKLNISQKKTEDEKIQASSMQYVAHNFPEMFTRDTSGNITGWDNSSELTKLTQKYAKQFKDRPDFMREAARQAFADINIKNRLSSNTEVELARSEVARAKMTNIVRPGSSAEINTLQKQVDEAYSKFKKTGSVTDATSYTKLKGKLSAIQK